MTIEIKDSANYAAQVIRVPEPFALPNADRLVGLNVLGYTVITAKDGEIQEGNLAVFFPAESQLSEGLAWFANLHRHTDRNQNPAADPGYLEDNRRVRALKLRGTVSNGLILPVQVVEDFLGLDDAHGLYEGAIFDTVNGVEISRKYRIKEPVQVDRAGKKIKKAFKRVDSTLLPEHIDTDQWLRNDHIVSDDEILIVTQKLHGTSARFANTVVRRELKWWERALVKLGVSISDTEYDTVAGSRKSIKDPNNPNQKHFYGEDAGDLWTDYLKRIESAIPKGYVVYGEIVGWTKNGAAIQKGHTYNLDPTAVEGRYNELYVYRVATVNPDGYLTDLSWDQVRNFASTRGLKTVPELWRGFKKNFNLDLFVERDFATEYGQDQSFSDAMSGDVPVPLSKGGTGKDEGIAIRVDGAQIPALFKFKNPSHYLYETAQLDAGEADIESEES